MSITVILELHVKPDLTEQVKAGFKDLLPDTRTFAGCEGIQVLQNQEQPDMLLVLEQWASREHFDAYLKWRTDRGDIDTIVSFSTTPHQFTFFEYVGA